MTEANTSGSGRTYTIEESATSEGLTVREPATGVTYEIADITDETAREYVTTLESGSRVRLELVPDRDETRATITDVMPVSVPDSYGKEYTVENCCM